MCPTRSRRFSAPCNPRRCDLSPRASLPKRAMLDVDAYCNLDIHTVHRYIFDMMKAKTTSAFDALNPQQRRAATHGTPVKDKGVQCGPLLIIAGAGTGKTNTLAHRVAHLVMNGVDPGRILMLTFSRRAAQEMRRRARDIVKQALNEPLGGLNQVLAQRLSWSGTFHSMANRLLRHYARHLKLDPQFTVIDRGDSADL